MTSDISNQVIEAILGPDLTRKLDNYLARDEGGERYTRLEAVQGSVGAYLAFARMGFEQYRAKQQKAREVRALMAQGLSV